VRTQRKATGSKRFASRAANFIRDKVLQDECPDTGCGIKVYWREAFLRLPFFTSMHRYLPALFQTYGYEVAYVPVNDRPRQAGISKYNNLNRALIGIYDLVGVTWIERERAHRRPDPDTHPVMDIAMRLKPVNDDGARASAGDKS
jgi:dolichol-phosphate mannosyltransferase